MKKTLLLEYTSETLDQLSERGVYKISNNIDYRVYNCTFHKMSKYE
jgi:hypothetical protein